MKNLLFLASTLLVASHVQAQTRTGLVDGIELDGYPAYEQIPPANTTMTNFFLGGLSIPGAPRATQGAPVYGDAVQNCGTNANSWVITYDDGPAPYQDIILNSLNSLRMKASFFSIGSSLKRYSASGKKIYDQGHELVMHTWSHPALTTLTNDQIVAELYWSAKIIYDITGKVPRYFRPPFGDIDERVNAILKAMDIVPIIWNRDTLDYQMNTNARTEAQLLGDVDTWIAGTNPNGVISLQHDRFERPARVSPQVNQKIEASNYNVVSLEQCLSSSGRGAAYATSGKLYEIITGFKSASENPSDSRKNGTDTKPSQNQNGTTNDATSMKNMGLGAVLSAVAGALLL